MSEVPEFRVYVSSTKDDMLKERESAIRAIRRVGAVYRDSYRAEERGTVETCIDDVRQAHLYIGIVGQRSGWAPDGETRSITHIEFDACERSGKEPIPRLVFERTTNDKKWIDALGNDEAAKLRIAAFHKHIREKLQPLEFVDDKELEIALVDQIRRKREEIQRARAAEAAIFEPRRVWQTALRPVVLLNLAGSDEPAADMLAAAQPADFARGALRPDSPDLALQLDQALQRGEIPCLLLSSASLLRLEQRETASLAARLMQTLRRRCGIALVAWLGGPSTALPAGWAPMRRVDVDLALPGTQDAATSAAKLAADLRAHAPLASQIRLPLPWIALAPTAAEVQTLLAAPDAFGPFGEDARKRRQQFNQMVKAASKLQPNWPQRCYGTDRSDWRCFGADGPTVEQLVAGVARALNSAAQGTRERQRLQHAEVVPRSYDLDEYLDDRDGSRATIESMLQRGGLLIVDETALLHPRLRAGADRLLAHPRSAIVSVSACDPAHWATNKLLAESSFLRVGSLVNRFSFEQDPQCELALNSEQRVSRWLRGAIVRLLEEAEGRGRPMLVSRADQLLDATEGAAP